jgi:DNA-binding response OmpR family regulator
MNVLLVEDDVGIGRFICQGLRARGLSVHWERVGKDVRKLAAAGRFNAIILDLLLPDADGLDLCNDIRKAELGIPILVLTARTGLDDRLDGFSAGADDYMAKPFAFQELVARVQALLKRDRLRKPDPIVIGPLRVDPNTRSATWEGEPVEMGGRSFAMLLALANARGEVVSRAALLDEIWGDDIVTGNALDACASALRRSVGSVTDRVVVEAVRGQGYALRVSHSDADG